MEVVIWNVYAAKQLTSPWGLHCHYLYVNHFSQHHLMSQILLWNWNWDLQDTFWKTLCPASTCDPCNETLSILWLIMSYVETVYGFHCASEGLFLNSVNIPCWWRWEIKEHSKPFKRKEHSWKDPSSILQFLCSRK